MSKDRRPASLSKQKMLQAKKLIKEKRYEEAHAILERINHPTAKAWLAKLDEILFEDDDPFNDPHHPEVSRPLDQAKAQSTPSVDLAEYRHKHKKTQQKTSGHGCRNLLLTVLLVVVVASIVLYVVVVQPASKRAREEMSQRLDISYAIIDYCFDYAADYDYCRDYFDPLLDTHHEAAVQCYDQYYPSLVDFADCLIRVNNAN